jgi:hypothetical protein
MLPADCPRTNSSVFPVNIELQLSSCIRNNSHDFSSFLPRSGVLGQAAPLRIALARPEITQTRLRDKQYFAEFTLGQDA